MDYEKMSRVRDIVFMVVIVFLAVLSGIILIV